MGDTLNREDHEEVCALVKAALEEAGYATRIYGPNEVYDKKSKQWLLGPIAVDFRWDAEWYRLLIHGPIVGTVGVDEPVKIG